MDSCTWSGECCIAQLTYTIDGRGTRYWSKAFLFHSSRDNIPSSAGSVSWLDSHQTYRIRLCSCQCQYPTCRSPWPEDYSFKSGPRCTKSWTRKCLSQCSSRTHRRLAPVREAAQDEPLLRDAADLEICQPGRVQIQPRPHQKRDSTFDFQERGKPLTSNCILA